MPRALGTTTSAPFGSCANASIAPSISAALCTPARANSILNVGAAASMACRYARYKLCGQVGLENDQHTHCAGDGISDQFEPFAADGVFEIGKPGDVGARPGEVRDDTEFDRIGNLHEHEPNDSRLKRCGPASIPAVVTLLGTPIATPLLVTWAKLLLRASRAAICARSERR